MFSSFTFERRAGARVRDVRDGTLELRIEILEVLKRKKYAGPASVELFDPTIQATDPYTVAQRARSAVDALLG